MSSSDFGSATPGDNEFWAKQIVPLPPTDLSAVEALSAADPFVSSVVLSDSPTESHSPTTDLDAVNVPIQPSTRGSVVVEVIGQSDESIGFDGIFQTDSIADVGAMNNSFDQDSSSYWNQIVTENFVPGISPPEAYPVCQDFKDRFPAESPAAQVAHSGLRPQTDTDYFYFANESADNATKDIDASYSSEADCVVERDSSAEPAAAKAESISNATNDDSEAIADQIIQVDGNDGYDFLDLEAFELSQATFANEEILLNAGEQSIRIQYKNIVNAVFAGGVTVALDSQTKN